MFKNLNIRKKLLSSFIIVAILTMTVGIVSGGMITRLQRNYSASIKEHSLSQENIFNAISTLDNAHRSAHDIISFTDKDMIATQETQLQQQLQKYNEYYQILNTIITTEELKTVYNNIAVDFQKYGQKRDELIAMTNASDVQERMVSELEPLFQSVYSGYDQLLELEIQISNQSIQKCENIATAALVLNGIFMVVVLVVSIVIGSYLSRYISAPLRACAERLKLLAKGNLQAEVPTVDSNDETGELAEATQIIVHGLTQVVKDLNYLLTEMSNNNFNLRTSADQYYIGDFENLLLSVRKINFGLSDTLRQINESSNQVASGSEQVASGAQALSQGATEQASSVEELAATITEISGQAQSNAENAQNASKQVHAVGDEMMQSNNQMQQMIQAMGEISSSSNEIKKIIKTIEDIAFQTNILALNAAVEAARAGTAGKGFAVVADEVRNLASKSAEASQNTANLIESSMKAVENGTVIADETAKSLLKAVDGTREVASTIEKISQASLEQASAISQVTLGIDQISAVVQTNSATSEQSAAASEEMSSQAQMLKELVGKFILRDDSSNLKSSYTPHVSSTREVVAPVSSNSIDYDDKY